MAASRRACLLDGREEVGKEGGAGDGAVVASTIAEIERQEW